MRNIDHAYDQFLVSHEQEMIDSLRRFEERIEHSLIKFGRFSVPTFFKCQFITHKQERLLKLVSEQMTSIIDKVANLYFTEPAIAGKLGFSEEAKRLIAIDPGYSRCAVLLRFDGFLEGESLKLIEVNADSPAGMGYADMLEDVFFGTKELEPFFSTFHLNRERRSERLLKTLLHAYEEFGGTEEKPNIAIVDWRTVKTRSEFEYLKQQFEDKGFRTVITDPRDLHLKGDKLYYGGFRIDLVYRRAVFNELLEKLDEIKDFITAYEKRWICMVNPLRSKLVSSKAVLSILTNPEYDRFFSDKENEIKRECLPWTRRLIDADKFYGGRKIYLIDFLKDEKDSLVLKPSEGYGGEDVIIGSETKEDDWNRIIDRALKGNWVVQEFVTVPIMTVPVIVNNRFDFQYKRTSLGAFSFNGHYAGGMARLSDRTVINVSSGGGIVAVVSVEETINR
ncbi:MAG: glutathionylspermidine synthase family protein [Candidatus Omnitrophica bacterium]|nr:glutathionylspermidine synthase family protein [Candidatus Omnitrophota bacterium]